MAIAFQTDLARQVQEECGENVYLCYQCKKCSAGCPVAEHFDLTPHQLLRALQFGQKDTVLRSKTIWLCAACEACSTRCPQGVNLPLIMDVLKIMAKSEGVKPAVRPVPNFYVSAMRGINIFGRMYELGLMAELYLRMFLSGELNIKQLIRWDIALALGMLMKGKLKPLPPLNLRAKHHRETEADGDGQAVAYYPGCSLHGTAVDYDMSTRAVADKIGLELVEPDGWICCGTTRDTYTNTIKWEVSLPQAPSTI